MRLGSGNDWCCLGLLNDTISLLLNQFNSDLGVLFTTLHTHRHVLETHVHTYAGKTRNKTGDFNHASSFGLNAAIIMLTCTR